MTRFTDRSGRNVAIAMKVWNPDECQYGLDWERDFFEVGGLLFIEDEDAYLVDDVEYLIEQALDWKYGRGDQVDDYEGEDGHRPEHRTVIVNGEFTEE